MTAMAATTSTAIATASIDGRQRPPLSDRARRASRGTTRRAAGCDAARPCLSLRCRVRLSRDAVVARACCACPVVAVSFTGRAPVPFPVAVAADVIALPVIDALEASADVPVSRADPIAVPRADPVPVPRADPIAVPRAGADPVAVPAPADPIPVPEPAPLATAARPTTSAPSSRSALAAAAAAAARAWSDATGAGAIPHPA